MHHVGHGRKSPRDPLNVPAIPTNVLLPRIHLKTLLGLKRDTMTRLVVGMAVSKRLSNGTAHSVVLSEHDIESFRETRNGNTSFNLSEIGKC